MNLIRKGQNCRKVIESIYFCLQDIPFPAITVCLDQDWTLWPDHLPSQILDRLDLTDPGVQSTLDQMRAESKAAREAARTNELGDRQRERDEKVAAAQADLEAAIDRANDATASSAGL